MKLTEQKGHLIVLLVALFPIWTPAQKPTDGRIRQSLVDLPTGDRIEFSETVRLVQNSEKLYPGALSLWHREIKWHKPDKSTETVFRGPSSITEFDGGGSDLPTEALMDDSRLELLRHSNGSFTHYRFKRNLDRWQLAGIQEMVDFSTRGIGSMNSPNDYAKGFHLMDFGKIEVMTFGDRNRLLTIDDEGAVLEDNLPFKYNHASGSDGITELERNRLRYKMSVAEYNEPRDANGVPLSVIANFKKQSAKSSIDQPADEKANSNRNVSIQKVSNEPAIREPMATEDSFLKTESQSRFMPVLIAILGFLGLVLIVRFFVRKPT